MAETANTIRLYDGRGGLVVEVEAPADSPPVLIWNKRVFGWHKHIEQYREMPFAVVREPVTEAA